MKKSMVVICIFFYCIQTQSQSLQLSGKINDRYLDSVEMNILFEEGYYKENSVCTKPDANGKFGFFYPSKKPQFILLKYMDNEQRLLLTPGRPLHIQIDSGLATNGYKLFGKAKMENDILGRFKMTNLLFFTAGLEGDSSNNNKYVAWSMDSVIKILIPFVKKRIDTMKRSVDESTLPVIVKKSLTSEIKYEYWIEFEKFVRAWVRHLIKYGYVHKDVEEFHKKFVDEELMMVNLPTKEELDLSVSAKVWLDVYAKKKFDKIFYPYSNDPDKNHANKVYDSAVGISISQEAALTNSYGVAYSYIIVRSHLFPTYAAEGWIAYNIYLACDKAKDLQLADNLLQYLMKKYPKSHYGSICASKIADVQRLSEKYSNNPNIRVRQDYRLIKSLKDLIKPYAGKVIYLDMWGTWCGPCMEEMKYVSSLKQHFKDNSVVFLYVDYDEDKYELRWRNFIYISNLVGEHIRMTRENINIVWDGLGGIEPGWGYPHYCIFDKAGNLVIKDARRPSAGQALYDQLNDIVNK